MAVFTYPLASTTAVTAAAGSDFATETTLLLVESAVDGLETLVGTTNTKLDTVITHVDGIEALIGTTNTNTSNINTQLTNKLSGSLVNVQYDNFAVAYNALNDVYTYKLAAATVKTVTITYTDATKQVISTVAAV